MLIRHKQVLANNVIKLITNSPANPKIMCKCMCCDKQQRLVHRPLEAGRLLYLILASSNIYLM